MFTLLKNFVAEIVPTMRNWPQLVLVATFALSIFPAGIPSPVGVMCVSTLFMVLGLLWVGKHRLATNRSLMPAAVLTTPVVIACAVYFAIGIASVMNADNPTTWFREIVQRTIIIWLPMFVFCLVPQKPEDIKKAILAYLPFCIFIALVAFWDARHSGFSKPSYALGMHKNHIAGSCSVMATIAIAALLTSKNAKRRLIMIGVIGASLLGCFSSQGKAGLCCIVVATLFMLVASGTKPKRILYFGLAVALCGGIFWKLMPDEAKEHVVSTKKFSTNEIRMSLWSDVLPVLSSDPFYAVGWGQLLVKNNRFYGDCANVLLFDWFQMTILGPIALLGIIVLSIKQCLDNAKRVHKESALAFINLVALGVFCGRFFHGMVDSFWIGRGVTLTTWAAIGMGIFVKLYLDQLQRRGVVGQGNKAPLVAVSESRLR